MDEESRPFYRGRRGSHTCVVHTRWASVYPRRV